MYMELHVHGITWKQYREIRDTLNMMENIDIIAGTFHHVPGKDTFQKENFGKTSLFLL